MIDEKILLERIQKIKVEPRQTPEPEYDYAIVFNQALEAVEDCVECMKKEEPIIANPDDEIRNKIHDLEFERDFYKMHFEDLYRRKVEG